MPAPLDPVKVQEIMRALGVMPADMDALRRLPLEQAKIHLEQLKERVRKNYRQLAFELHPDRTGGDPEKTERFKLVGTIKDEFEKLQIQARPQMFVRPPQPQMRVQPMRVVQVVSWATAGNAYTRTNAGGTTVTIGFGMPLRVATMKPT